MDKSIKDYAWTLYQDQGLSWNQVRYHLVSEKGISERAAQIVIDELKLFEEEELIKEENQKAEREKEENLREILREDKSDSPLERAQMKISIGIGCIIIGTILFGLLVSDGYLLRFPIGIVIIGIYLMSRGIKSKKVIYKNNREK